MSVQTLRLFSFRNLDDAEIFLDSERVFLIGENGQGKTNLLEALYYLSFGSSFRGQVDASVPRRGSQEFALEGSITSNENRAIPPEHLEVVWKNRTKEIRREGKTVRDRKELIELNPAIVYCHEDFEIAAGEPERRRFFFDQTASLVSLGYIDLLREYRKILSQRNTLLKEGRNELLDILDLQLATKGLALMKERKEIAASFSVEFGSLFETVSRLGSKVALEYRPSWKGEPTPKVEEIAIHLESRRREDLAFRTSLSGPHRDRWVFMAEGRDFTSTASTGQLRLISLILRSSQAMHYSSRSGRLPLLLLDDVLLELDPARRIRFFETLPKCVQSIFTFLPGETWEDYRSTSTLVYSVTNGRFAI
jgi:DNA replication and repair protein RecF